MFERTVLTASALTLAACQSVSTTPATSAPAAPAASVAAATPAPAWQQGRTPDQATSTLAPHAGRNTATPVGEIPIDKFKLPPGFKAEIWASGMPGARAMARGESGKIYVGTRGIGRVYEITDTGGQRVSRIVVDKLVQPAGVAVKDGSLYVIAIDKVLRYDGIEKNPAAAPVDMTAVFALPKEQHHNWKYIAFGPDNKLYVPFGAPCNICEPTAEYAQIRRYNADGSGMISIPSGDRHPRSRALPRSFQRHPGQGSRDACSATGQRVVAKRPNDSRTRLHEIEIGVAGDRVAIDLDHASARSADADRAIQVHCRGIRVQARARDKRTLRCETRARERERECHGQQPDSSHGPSHLRTDGSFYDCGQPGGSITSIQDPPDR